MYGISKEEYTEDLSVSLREAKEKICKPSINENNGMM